MSISAETLLSCGNRCPLWPLINEGELVKNALSWVYSESGIVDGYRDTRYQDVDMTTQDLALACKRKHIT